MIHVHHMVVGWQSLDQDTGFHGNFIVDIGMLAFGQIGGLFLFQLFEPKELVGDFVLAYATFGEIAHVQGLVHRKLANGKKASGSFDCGFHDGWFLCILLVL